jgi:hypothetical protein
MEKPLFLFGFLVVFPALLFAKNAPTYHTREEIEKARTLCRTEDWAKKSAEKARENAQRWKDMSDEELWNFVLDARIPRALNVRFGVECPIHGEEVFRKGGHYPWILNSDAPFKVKCPVGGEIYPTNDFESWLKSGRKGKLNTREKYVDDGFGWIDENGDRYWFVGHYIFWHRWRKEILDSAIPSLGNAYELTGDPVYAHKLGVMLGRFCIVYPQMDYSKQAYHNGKWPAEIDGRILDYIWENSTIHKLAIAYDQIFDAIDDDKELGKFLQDRGIDDLKRQYEQKVLHFMARDIMAGRIRGNMHYQPTLALLARIIDNNNPSFGPMPNEMVDWLLYGRGEIEIILNNGFDRDGAGGESAPGYCTIWNSSFCNLADDLMKLDVDIISPYPRWKQIIHFPYNLTLCGKYSPNLGDSGRNIYTSSKIINDTILKFGYRHFNDPLCAQLLLKQNVFGNSLWGENLDRKEVEQVAKSAPDLTNLRTRNLGGYGLAVLETGEGENRRAATLYYGSPQTFHTHIDRLTIDFWANGRTFLPEMGYPSHWNDKGARFVRGMASHYVVVMDEKSCKSRKSGFLDSFASGSKVRVVRAHSTEIYRDLAKTYERTFAMIDAGDDSFLIDLFCVEGGETHDYLFHGLPFGDFTARNLEMVSEQKKGTLLGEDIEWGGDKSGNESGYDFFKNVRRYKPQGTWSVSWKTKDDDRLSWFMPSFPEVIVCDGEPPFHPGYPEKMEFLFVRNKNSKSMFPSVICPSRGKDPVKDVNFEITDDRVYYRVTTEKGVWNIRVDKDGGFSADCAHTSGTLYGFHVNREEFPFADKIVNVRDPRRYVIDSVDYKDNTVKTTRPISKPELLQGEVAVISGSGHSASYTVKRATENSIEFEGTCITGICEVSSLKKNIMTTKSRVSGFGSQLCAKSLKGMVLVTEDYANGFPIESYGLSKPLEDSMDDRLEEYETSFTLKMNCEFPDVNSDSRRNAWFADFAPGYEIRFSPWVELENTPQGEIKSRSNTTFKIVTR